MKRELGVYEKVCAILTQKKQKKKKNTIKKKKMKKCVVSLFGPLAIMVKGKTMGSIDPLGSLPVATVLPRVHMVGDLNSWCYEVKNTIFFFINPLQLLSWYAVIDANKIGVRD